MKRQLAVTAIAAVLAVFAVPARAARIQMTNDGRWVQQAFSPRQEVHHVTARRHRVFHRHRRPIRIARRHSRDSVSYAGLPGPLAGKVNEIKLACGSTVISAYRPGAVIAGTHHRSLHAIGRAVDMSGNSGCIYSHLRDWPGGYSTDYARMRHVHISYMPGGQEWGSRFIHGGGHRYARRYRHIHYATLHR